MFYKNFVKALKDETILALDIEDVQEEQNSITLYFETTDTQVIAQTAIAISDFIGDKNQNIYVERFGNSSTCIAIENPMLCTEMGMCEDTQGRDRSDHANIIEEMNCHELPRNTATLNSVNDRISADA